MAAKKTYYNTTDYPIVVGDCRTVGGRERIEYATTPEIVLALATGDLIEVEATKPIKPEAAK